MLIGLFKISVTKIEKRILRRLYGPKYKDYIYKWKSEKKLLQRYRKNCLFNPRKRYNFLWKFIQNELPEMIKQMIFIKTLPRIPHGLKKLKNI